MSSDEPSPLRRWFSGLCPARPLRQRLQQAIEERHAMQAILDNIPAPIFAKNVEGLYTHCNRAFLEYLGLPREGVIGKTVHDVAPPDLASVYADADRRLLAAGGRQIYDAQVQWADGGLRDVTFYKAVWYNQEGQPAGQAGAIFDITERRRLEKELRLLAETDDLTGRLNRRSFLQQADRMFLRAREHGACVALLLFDLDHFKELNDAFGHATGDAVLCHVCDLVGQQLREEDRFGRIGGDEFAIAAYGAAQVHTIAERLPELLDQSPFLFGDRFLPIGISVGGAIVDPAEVRLDEAIARADRALYEAKRQGRRRAVIFERPAPDPADDLR
ncbi:sensory box/response regulator [Burkholderiales bacterium GJ-E10]|nr:sensory box/response regulator [Burkholderiales bacterium GJ-E10]